MPKVESPLRDLSRKIEEASRDHPAWSQAHVAVLHLISYLSAMAFMEEGRERERRLQQLEKTMMHLGDKIEGGKVVDADDNRGPALLKTGPTDKELAAELRRKMALALGEVGAIMDEAEEKGLNIGFQMGKDFRGKNVVAGLVVSRPL